MPLIRKGAEIPPPAPAAVERVETLREGSDDERFAAARSLSGRPDAVGALSAALSLERDARVREAILTSLARIGSVECVTAITPLIRSDDASLRTAALDALRLMPGAVAAHLAALLSDSDADVRLLAAELARQLPGPLATELLCAVLEREGEANVCAAALDVLAEVGGPEALPTLERCRERFADEPFVAFAIRVTADRISDRPPEAHG